MEGAAGRAPRDAGEAGTAVSFKVARRIAFLEAATHMYPTPPAGFTSVYIANHDVKGNCSRLLRLEEHQVILLTLNIQYSIASVGNSQENGYVY